MRSSSYTFLLIVVCAGWIDLAVGRAAIVTLHSESVNGDLSGVSTSPTSFGAAGVLTANEYRVIGGTTSSPLDRDFWTITIPTNHRLASITLAAFTNTDNRSFFAVASGSSIPALNDPGILLGGTFVGDVVGRRVGDNLLDDLANRVHIGGTPQFSGPLGPGVYTFWSQETAGTVTYSYQFNVEAVPEPSSMMLFAVGTLAMAARRTQRRTRLTR
jgi:hypothetical protein